MEKKTWGHSPWWVSKLPRQFRMSYSTYKFCQYRERNNIVTHAFPLHWLFLSFCYSMVRWLVLSGFNGNAGFTCTSCGKPLFRTENGTCSAACAYNEALRQYAESHANTGCG